ncbi:hypothetical protein C0J52_26874 [Blattella germanica]|nr:hypothetical protein C0J52_26874 [Blattella germanica]
MNEPCYCDTQTKVRSVIRRVKMFSYCMPTQDFTQDQIRRFGWERLNHPTDNLYLAPSDFHLFPAMKAAFSAHHIENNGELEQTVRLFLAT